ncbi:MAG: LysM peptidoglycan-binding domain-containing protein [Opitutales bacterium]
MEEDIEASSGSSMMSIALAMLAFVLGGAGLYFGISAKQQITPLTASVDEGTSSSARLEKRLSSLETQLTELSTELGRLKGSVQRAGRETSQALRDASTSKQTATANREELIKLATAMQELVNSRGVSSGGTRSPAAPSISADGGTTSSGNASASVYTIRSGDTFGKIAAENGVSLDAILDANPDADPRRLRIGQEINLPVY